MRIFFVLTVVSAAACGPRQATVRVTIPDLEGVETPVPGLQVIFLPYDRDSIVRGLEAKATSPRPKVRELDSLFREFRAPYLEFMRVAVTTDRLRRKRDSLTGALGAGAPADPGVRAIEDSIARLTPAETAANAALGRTRERLGPSIDRFRAEAAKWERETYRSYEETVRSLGGRTFGNPVADTTDARGWATMTLTNGSWWVTARSIDPGDPNGEWYWNLKVIGDTVALNPRTGLHRPRY